MIQKKICMLGSYAVGKTSLVRQYVESIFSEKYQTTLGVKVDKKTVRLNNRTINLLLWDIQGEEAFEKVTSSYIRGAAGYLLVADGTRPETFDHALYIHERTVKSIGQVPFIILLNKADLTDQWAVSDEHMALIKEKKWQVFSTSAKTGESVEKAFLTLTELIFC